MLKRGETKQCEVNDFYVEFLFNSNFLFNPLMREFLFCVFKNNHSSQFLKVHISVFYVSRDQERKYMIQIWNFILSFFMKLIFMDFLFHDHFSLLNINITSISNPMMIPN